MHPKYLSNHGSVPTWTLSSGCMRGLDIEAECHMTCSFILRLQYTAQHIPLREAANLVTVPSPGLCLDNQNITRADVAMAMSPHLTSLRALNAAWPLYQWHLEAFPVPEIGKAQCNLHGLHTPGMQLLHARADEVRARLEATGRNQTTLAGHLDWHRRSRRLFSHVSSGLGPV
ncbi:hypothetical protein V8C34DRAFT_281951 [Trichoderma compactum]